MAGVLRRGDRVLALDPEMGSHTSHGSPKHISAQLYDFILMGLERDSCLINYDEWERAARQCRPRLILLGASAYPRTIDFQRIAHIAEEIGALVMADMAHMLGLVAAGIMPNPFPYADIVTGSASKTLCGPHSGLILCKDALAQAVDAGVYPATTSSVHLQSVAAMAHTFLEAGTPAFRATMERAVSNAHCLADALKAKGFSILTGGTDCHFLVADLRPLGLNAPKAANALQPVGVIVNTKRLPFDECATPQGLRIGTTVCAQRGMGAAEMDVLAQVISLAGRFDSDERLRNDCRDRVLALARQFPLPW